MINILSSFLKFIYHKCLKFVYFTCRIFKLTKMMVRISLLLICFISFSFAPNKQLVEKFNQQPAFKITILYDNMPFDTTLQTSWGFSALVQYKGKNILFDTGGKEDLLIENMNKLNIDPKIIDMVVLSHDHWDHYGSVVRILEEKPSIAVYMPSGSWKNVQDLIRIFKGKVIAVNKTTEIIPGIFLSGNYNEPVQEQSLIIKINDQSIMLSGCGHPGIAKMVKLADSTTHHPINIIVGGFMMKNKSGQQIKTEIESLKNLGVEKVAPSHCTGDSALIIMKMEFGEKYIPSGLGKVFTKDIF